MDSRPIYPTGHNDSIGQPYRPSNAHEADIFADAWCSDCRKRSRCKIPLRAMAHKVGDPGYPRSWRYDEAGQPACLAHDDRPPKPRTPRPCRRTADLFADQMPEARHG